MSFMDSPFWGLKIQGTEFTPLRSDAYMFKHEDASWGLTCTEANRMRQWFDCAMDIDKQFLEPEDYLLAKRLYEFVGMRVPHSILHETDGAPL